MSHKIILASQSPRRIELMKMAGFEFEVISKNIPEIHPENLDFKKIPEALALAKAKAVMEDFQHKKVCVIGADTIVLLENKIFEKPMDKDDACRMLRALSGKTHEVITGVAVLIEGKEITFSEVTKVVFNDLTDSEIDYYVDNYKPYDKAGAYACQEWIGAIAINRFEGDFYNVMGLPINKLYRVLKENLESKTN